MFRLICSLVAIGATAAACSTTTPGARPHDMSAAEHERHAQAHQQSADTHAAKHDPEARVEAEHCSPGTGRTGADAICWTSVRNPTAEHLRMAEQHRKHAADHRAASAALRDAEARACSGIDLDDRDISPFEHREDIVGVEPLTERSGKAPAVRAHDAGATVTFRAVPGMTAEWLQRVVDCHLARNSALGHSVPNMPDCPLVPKGAQATVRSTGNGFAVAIRADDPDAAREILARAQRLAPAAGASAAQ